MYKRYGKTTHVLKMVFSLSPVYSMLRVVLSIIEGLVTAGLLALSVANFVDKALYVINGNGVKRDIYTSLILLLIVFALFTTIGSVEKMVDARIRLDILRRMKPILIKKQAELEYKYIEDDDNWELIARVMRDPAMVLTEGFGAYVLVVQIVISIVSMMGLLIIHVWWAVLIIMAFSVPLFMIALKAGKKNYKAGVDAEKFNRRTEYLDNVLTGRDNIEERTLFNYGEEFINSWKGQYETGRKLQLNVALRQFRTMKTSSFILASLSLLIALTLVNPVIEGDLSSGLFIGIVSTVFGIINKLASQMTSAMERISRTNGYMNDYQAFLKLSRTEDALSIPQEHEDFQKLEFKNVSFKYPSNNEWTLKNMSFSLEKGKHYAFVGKNGAGKSTITKLITGLYTDYTGEILINGIDIKTLSQAKLKSMFSIVYQDFAKYSISLRDNITVGNINSMNSDLKLKNTIKIAGLDTLVTQLKNGVDTQLGKVDSDGQDVSGGQWQRIAIARTLFNDAAVRILDEPTSALDPIRESKVYHDFENLMKNKTTIFISHRLGSTKLADNILVIDNGRIIEQGTHELLMKMKGMYSEMYDSQRSWYA